MRTKLESLTAREREEMLFYSEERAMEREHEKSVRQLELAVEKELNKFNSLLRLPKLLVLLPVLPLVAIAIIVNAIKGEEPSDKIINLFK